MCASATEDGRGFSHRSGFHSSASSPHSALDVLHARRLTTIEVPLGTGISVMVHPSSPRMGEDRGRRVSARALEVVGCERVREMGG